MNEIEGGHSSLKIAQNESGVFPPRLGHDDGQYQNAAPLKACTGITQTSRAKAQGAVKRRKAPAPEDPADLEPGMSQSQKMAVGLTTWRRYLKLLRNFALLTISLMTVRTRTDPQEDLASVIFVATIR